MSDKVVTRADTWVCPYGSLDCFEVLYQFLWFDKPGQEFLRQGLTFAVKKEKIRGSEEVKFFEEFIVVLGVFGDVDLDEFEALECFLDSGIGEGDLFEFGAGCAVGFADVDHDRFAGGFDLLHEALVGVPLAGGAVDGFFGDSRGRGAAASEVIEGMDEGSRSAHPADEEEGAVEEEREGEEFDEAPSTFG